MNLGARISDIVGLLGDDHPQRLRIQAYLCNERRCARGVLCNGARTARAVTHQGVELFGHIRLGRPPVAQQGLKPGTSSCASSSQRVESDGDLPKSVSSSSLSVWSRRLANPVIPTSEPWALKIARTATISIHNCEKRMPRRIRQSEIALRERSRSLAVAGFASGSEDNGQEHFPRGTRPSPRPVEAYCRAA